MGKRRRVNGAPANKAGGKASDKAQAKARQRRPKHEAGPKHTKESKAKAPAPKPAANKAAAEEDDVEPTAEDIEFFTTTQSSFLASMELPDNRHWVNPKKEKRKRKNQDEETGEADFEKRPRVAEDFEAENAAQLRMPIKTSRGIELAKPRAASEPHEEPVPTGNAVHANGNGNNGPLSTTAAPQESVLKLGAKKPTKKEVRKRKKMERLQAELEDQKHREEAIRQAAQEAEAAAAVPLSKAERLATFKEEIAKVCSTILEDPEANTAKFHALLELCACKDKLVGSKVRKLAVVSTCTVFKDVLPGYRIRALSDKEDQAVVSKDVKRLRKYEQALVSHYQAYLDTVFRHIDGYDRKSTPKRSMALLGLKCICDMLIEKPHFNFRNNIILKVVPSMAVLDDDELSATCCSKMREVLRRDDELSTSLETVRAMSNTIKASSYRVRGQMVDCFLDLKLSFHLGMGRKPRIESASSKGKGKKKFLTRSAKRVHKVEKELDRDMQETMAETNKKRMAENQTNILKLVFATYFRVMKNAPTSPILSHCLEGLGKFSAMLDASYFQDTLASLESLMHNGELGSRIAMQCIKTASTILSGHGSAISIDVKTFHNALYQRLLSLPSEPDNLALALECLELAILRRREISIVRVGAFVKRLGEMVIQMEQEHAIAALAFLRQVLLKYPAVMPILDCDSLATGEYRADLPDPEHSNAFASTLWELSLVQKHYHPLAVDFARNVAAGVPAGGRLSIDARKARLHPLELCRDCRFDGPLNPTPRAPLPHPRAKSAADGTLRQGWHMEYSPARDASLRAAGDASGDGEADAMDVDFGAHYATTKLYTEMQRLSTRLFRLQTALKQASRK